MKRFIAGLLLISSSMFFYGCSEVPLTGRTRLDMVPDSTLNEMAAEQYADFISKHKLSTDASATAMVKRVGSNIETACENYFKSHGLYDQISDFDWEFNLVEDDVVNAWAMPGGKVVVYTGILKIANTEDKLAVVMSHEISHAIAKHGAERMSQQLLAQLGETALSIALEDHPAQTQAIFKESYGLAAQYGLILPYSRTHEYEADRMGMIFMAMAGYDPRVAEEFWKEMAAQSSGPSVPEWLSTHPSDESRIERIRENMPEALRYYKQG